MVDEPDARAAFDKAHRAHELARANSHELGEVRVRLSALESYRATRQERDRTDDLEYVELAGFRTDIDRRVRTLERLTAVMGVVLVADITLRGISLAQGLG